MVTIQYLLLIALGIVSYFINNKTVAFAILGLFIIRFTPLRQCFPYIEKQGLSLGILILTVAVLAPLISGSLPLNSMLKSLTDWKTIVAIVVGIFVSWLGGRGVALMSAQPNVVGGLIIGTVIGVAFFKGVPVGPLIAAGIVSLLLFSR